MLLHSIKPACVTVMLVVTILNFVEAEAQTFDIVAEDNPSSTIDTVKSIIQKFTSALSNKKSTSVLSTEQLSQLNDYLTTVAYEQSISESCINDTLAVLAGLQNRNMWAIQGKKSPQYL